MLLPLPYCARTALLRHCAAGLPKTPHTCCTVYKHLPCTSSVRIRSFVRWMQQRSLRFTPSRVLIDSRSLFRYTTDATTITVLRPYQLISYRSATALVHYSLPYARFRATAFSWVADAVLASTHHSLAPHHTRLHRLPPALPAASRYPAFLYHLRLCAEPFLLRIFSAFDPCRICAYRATDAAGFWSRTRFSLLYDTARTSPKTLVCLDYPPPPPPPTPHAPHHHLPPPHPAPHPPPPLCVLAWCCTTTLTVHGRPVLTLVGHAVGNDAYNQMT